MAPHDRRRRALVVPDPSFEPAETHYGARTLPLPDPRRATLVATILCVGLAGCASQRERVAVAIADWDALDASFVRAMDDPVAPITSAATLADYVALALARNPGYQASSQRWLADLERVPQARSLPDPQLTYGGFLEEVETRVGPQRHRFGVSQRVPWPGKLYLAGEMAFEESEAARARSEAARLSLVFQVTGAYAEYYYLARDVAITEETLTLLRNWEAVAQVRFRAGAQAAHRDVVKAQVEIGRLEDRLASLRDMRRPRVERLRALLDLPRDFDLPWPSTIPERALGLSETAAFQTLLERSPVLAEHRQRVAARERGVDLAWQSYLPDFVFGLDYTEVGPARAANVRGSGDDSIMGMFGLSLPIWFGRNEATVSEARARLRAAELERADTENALQAALTRALFDYRDAERKVRLYRDSLVPKAEESLQATVTAWEAGNGDLLNVLDAERLLLEFHLQRERALANRITALTEIESLIGSELPPTRREEPR
mgnify:CR=1 FL=1